MCDPISIIGLALSAGGTVMNGMAANEAAKARASTLEAERFRQQGLQAQQSALSDQSQQTMQNFAGDQQDRAADLSAYYREPVASDANAEAGMVPTDGMSSIAVREMQKQSGNATAKANQSADSLASMRSFGDLLGERMRGIQRSSGEIDQLTGFRRGSSDVLASELEAAAQKGAGKQMLGDLLSGAGSIATGYGGMANAGNQAVTGWVKKTNDRLSGLLGV